MRHSRSRAVLARIASFASVLLLGIATPSSAQTVPLETFTITDSELDTIYSAYGSHNQRMVWTPGGLFLVYVVTESTDTSRVHWKLVRSRDNGQTFTLVMSGNGLYPNPVIDADEHGNVYLVHSSNPDLPNSSATFVKLTPESGYVHNPSTDRILANGGAQKSVLLYDASRNRLYYVANNNYVMNFFGLDLAGNEVYPHYEITIPPNVSQYGNLNAHYPLLSIDNGNLYFGWTTLALVGNNSSYYSTHFMVSTGGGTASSWRKPNGQSIAIPVVADPTGQSILINAAADTNQCTWMQSLLARDGKVHASYSMCNPSRVSYARFSASQNSVELRLNPWGAEVNKSAWGLHGSFTSHRDPLVSTIYSTQKTLGNDLTVLASSDFGSTWTKRASLPIPTGEDLYGMGGPRWVTPDGYLTGVYAKYQPAPIVLKLYRAKVASALFAAPVYWSNNANYTGWEKGVGDTTGDGRSDIILRAHDSSSWRTWTAAGTDTGSFGAPVSWTAPGNFQGLSAGTGDFNGDGKMDQLLYALDATSFRTRVALSTGGGNYAAPVSWADAVNYTGWTLGLGDFNGDSKTDVMAWVVDSASWRSWVMPSLGNGAFSSSVGFNAPGDYTSFTNRERADCTGDGRTDQLLWKLNSTGLHTRLARATGTGSFSTPVAWSDAGLQVTGWPNFAVADLNADGKADLLIFIASSTSIRAWSALSSGDGNFSRGPDFHQAGDYSGLSPVVADFNGDGSADLGLLAADATAWRIWLATGAGTGGFRAMKPWSSPWHFGGWTPLIGRFNVDAKADLLLMANDASGWRTYNALSAIP